MSIDSKKFMAVNKYFVRFGTISGIVPIAPATPITIIPGPFRFKNLIIITKMSCKTYDAAFVAVSPYAASGAGMALLVDNNRWIPAMMQMIAEPPTAFVPLSLRRGDWSVDLVLLLNPGSGVQLAVENAGAIACLLENDFDYIEYNAQVIQEFTEADIIQHCRTIMK